jgi:deoxyadenosine/deoxycytidine kinase
MKAGQYLAIEGPIGVGKSTLAARLAADLGVGLLSENPDANPFLGDFYADPGGHALAAQLCFLLQRVHQIDALRQSDRFRGGCVADFMFAKDALFARLNLSASELALYDQVHARLAGQAPQPDRVIYLEASLDTLMTRINQRSRPAEAQLKRAYLARVVAAYRDFFAAYGSAPSIRVDAEQTDLLGNVADYRALLAALNSSASEQWLPAR